MPKSRLVFREVPEPSVWLQVPTGGGWTVEYRLAGRGEEITFAELRLHAPGGKVPERGVDSSLVRSIPVGEHRQLVLEHLDELIEKYGDVLLAPRGLLERHGLAEVVTKRGQRREDVYFAQIASRYAELVAAGVRRPLPIIAEEIGRRPSSVASAVTAARRMGFLTAAESGRAGGRLTDRARRLLRQAEKGGTE